MCFSCGIVTATRVTELDPSRRYWCCRANTPRSWLLSLRVTTCSRRQAFKFTALTRRVKRSRTGLLWSGILFKLPLLLVVAVKEVAPQFMMMTVSSPMALAMKTSNRVFPLRLALPPQLAVLPLLILFLRLLLAGK